MELSTSTTSKNPIEIETGLSQQPPSTSISSPQLPTTDNCEGRRILSKNKQRKLRRYEKSLEHRKERRVKEREIRKQRGSRKRRGNDEKLVEIEKLKNAFKVGCKVAIDCQYQDHMSTKELTRFAHQLRRVYSSNRSSESPLHLYLTSLSRDSELFRICCKQNEGFTSYVLDINAKSVQDIFDPSEVVYLTPDASTVISINKGFEKDKVYVIGGLVDETTNKNLTRKFAQTSQITCVRLPIDEFFEQGLKGTFKKVLTINQVVDIILEWHKTHSWVAAISKGLPERTGFRPRLSQPSSPTIDGQLLTNL